MKDVYDFAKFFIKNGADSAPNTYDGNMKLQKLLVLADFANIVKYGNPLFDNPVLAFKNGCVIEKVRLRYKNDYAGFKKDSDVFEPNFTDSEYDILNTILSIFGNQSAKELSEINHTFDFWKTAYAKGSMANGYHDKELSVVDMSSQGEDGVRMRQILDAYEESCNDNMQSDVINGITFYFDDFKLTDDLIDQLENFSLSAEDNSYTVYLDNGKLVIY